MTPEQERLLGAVIGMVRAADSAAPEEETFRLLLDCLKGCDRQEELSRLTDLAHREKDRLAPDCAKCASPCGRTADFDLSLLRYAPREVCCAKEELLSLLLRLAREKDLPERFGEAQRLLFFRALFAVGEEWASAQDIFSLSEELSGLFPDWEGHK